MLRSNPGEIIRAATVAIGNAATLLANAGVDDETLKGNGKVYEAWILLALGTELGELLQGSPVWYTGRYRPVEPGEPIVFRGSPAKLRREGGQTPGFLMLEVPDGGAIELHNSLQFEGASQVDHELDICLLYKRDREAWVAGAANLPHLAGLELKCHARAIPLPLVRQAALTHIDLSARRGGHGHASTYHGFVTLSSLSENGRILARYYDLNVFERIGEKLTNPLAPSRVAPLAKAIFGWWGTHRTD